MGYRLGKFLGEYLVIYLGIYGECYGIIKFPMITYAGLRDASVPLRRMAWC